MKVSPLNMLIPPPYVPNQKLPWLSSRIDQTQISFIKPSCSVKFVKVSPLYMLTPPQVQNQILPSLSSNIDMIQFPLKPSFRVKFVKVSPLYMLTPRPCVPIQILPRLSSSMEIMENDVIPCSTSRYFMLMLVL